MKDVIKLKEFCSAWLACRTPEAVDFFVGEGDDIPTTRAKDIISQENIFLNTYNLEISYIHKSKLLCVVPKVKSIHKSSICQGFYKTLLTGL